MGDKSQSFHHEKNDSYVHLHTCEKQNKPVMSTKKNTKLEAKVIKY